MAVEHVLGKIKEGKKLSTEDVLVLYLGTIVNELKDVRSGGSPDLRSKIDKTNQRRRDEQKDRRDHEKPVSPHRRNKQKDRRDE